MMTSGAFRQSSARATRAFCPPDRSFMRMVCAWPASPKVPSCLRAFSYGKSNNRIRYSEGVSSAVKCSPECWSNLPSFCKNVCETIYNFNQLSTSACVMCILYTYHPMVHSHFTNARLQVTGQQLEECRLAYTVGPNNSYPGVEVNAKINVLKQGFLIGICKTRTCVIKRGTQY